MKSLALHRKPRERKIEEILLGLVELYLKNGKPIGSNTLKEKGFAHISSATIRNYFVQLEKEGFVAQQHSSGGRVPTTKALQWYAEKMLSKKPSVSLPQLEKFLTQETKEISAFLSSALEEISHTLGYPVFLSLPKLEMDFIQQIKLISLFPEKILAVFVTDYGVIQSEFFSIKETLTPTELEDIERYFYWRLSKKSKPSLTEKLLKTAQRLYNEIALRHVIQNAKRQWAYTGLSQLLPFASISDTTLLASGLSLFESEKALEKIIVHCMQSSSITCLIGEKLSEFAPKVEQASLLGVPYFIGSTPVGCLALFGPLAIPYPFLLAALRKISTLISRTLTESVYKYQIGYQAFSSDPISSQEKPLILLDNKMEGDIS